VVTAELGHGARLPRRLRRLATGPELALSVQDGHMSGDPSKYADGKNTEWVLTGFSKETNEVSSEYPITREQLVTIRPLFPVGDDLWFADMYEVTAEHWPTLRDVLHCGQPDPGHDYFVHGWATA
jgi:hypothetical protein